MSNTPTTPGRIFSPEDVRLVRRVFDRIKDEGHLSQSPERQDAFAAYLLDMFFRGMVVEAGLYGLGVAAAKARFGAESKPGGQDIQLPACKVLVVEDDYLLASDIQKTLEKAGAIVLGPFGSENGALTALQSEVPDLALIDLNLGEGVRFEVAEQLSHKSVPLCVVSGYIRSDFAWMPDFLQSVPWIRKPVALHAVLEIAAGLCSGGSPGNLRALDG